VSVPDGIVEYRDSAAQAPPLTFALLERGQERFRIYCTPCHSELGDGHGMIVQRGFPPPPSYHIDRLREAPIEHFYEVMTQGFGAMYPFADRVSPQDRWAIAAYIRALQKSHAVNVADVPPAERGALE
jgi:mono/diheme cytochrome c family protein